MTAHSSGESANFRSLADSASLDKQRSPFQMPRRANVENDRRVASVEQLGHESLAEISRPSGQQHLHTLLPTYLRCTGNMQA